jgi:16S rRNA (guanine(966)-N(2))-methyltransferase RsmD
LPSTIRPTTDRVKESIFNILGSRGGVADLEVVDLFCGSGALGIEALSRGAKSVVFVDADARAIEAVRANLASTGLADGAVRCLTTSAAGFACPPCDLVFMDPPYDLTDIGEILEGLDAGTVVVESRLPVPETARWATTSERRYGTTLITVLDLRPDSAENS